jgi:tRNA (Thr-GGU) A37 N-methylase
MHPCRPDIPEGCLEGLEQYSHVWVLYIFHCNTDLQRLWSPDHASDGLKAKVQVPRLNGQRMGVLATRSPHRPSPIGEHGHRTLWTSAGGCSTPAAS